MYQCFLSGLKYLVPYIKSFSHSLAIYFNVHVFFQIFSYSYLMLHNKLPQSVMTSNYHYQFIIISQGSRDWLHLLGLTQDHSSDCRQTVPGTGLISKASALTCLTVDSTCWMRPFHISSKKARVSKEINCELPVS